MDIRPIDPADGDALAAWRATHAEALTSDHAYAYPRALPELRAQLQADRVGEHVELHGGYVDGRLVTAGRLEVPLKDNLSSASVEVATCPEHRRRGHGSAMLDHLARLAVSHGRSRLDAQTGWGVDDAPDGTGTPGAAFAARHGFRLLLVDVQRVLDLPVDDDVLDRLWETCVPHLDGYDLPHFTGPVPEPLVAAYGELVGSLMTQAPMGGLEIEDEVLDAERIRSEEAVLAAAGRTRWTTLAVSADGDLAGYSEIVASRHEPRVAFQWGTLVAPAHRGRRLGTAMKVRNLRRFQRARTGQPLLMTYNAEVNAHMVAVNEALGFRVVGRAGEFQRHL